MNSELRAAVLLAMEHFNEDDWKRVRAQIREEIRNAPLEADDDNLNPDVSTTLRQHGCTIEQHEGFHRVTFPQGSTCTLLIRVISSHYLITLPSGLRVKQIEKANRKYSLLYILEGPPNARYPSRPIY